MSLFTLFIRKSKSEGNRRSVTYFDKQSFRFLRKLTWICLLFLTSSLLRLSADELPYSVLNLPKAVMGESCVEPVSVMREKHMDLLFHQRDKTMYQGTRDEKHSLIGCLNCHTQKDAQGQFIPINEKGQFCEVCHSYTAVKMDCFGCHATTPGNNTAMSSEQ